LWFSAVVLLKKAIGNTSYVPVGGAHYWLGKPQQSQVEILDPAHDCTQYIPIYLLL
jgi:hypothetical protein